MPSTSIPSMDGQLPIGTTTGFRHAATRYLAAGLAAIPAVRKGSHKKACVAWTQFQTRVHSESEWDRWADLQSPAIAIVAGAVSGLEPARVEIDTDQFRVVNESIEALARAFLEIASRSLGGAAIRVVRCGRAHAEAA